jgi:hypothetical protein
VQVFRLEPAQGHIAPGATMEVQVIFTSVRATTVRESKDIRCRISEPLTGEVVEELTLVTSARSVYSALRLQVIKAFLCLSFMYCCLVFLVVVFKQRQPSLGPHKK